MTHEELIRELEAVLAKQDNPEGYYTTGEYVEMWGESMGKVRAALKALQSVGRLDMQRKTIQGLDRQSRVPAYRILPT